MADLQPRLADPLPGPGHRRDNTAPLALDLARGALQGQQARLTLLPRSEQGFDNVDLLLEQGQLRVGSHALGLKAGDLLV